MKLVERHYLLVQDKTSEGSCPPSLCNENDNWQLSLVLTRDISVSISITFYVK